MYAKFALILASFLLFHVGRGALAQTRVIDKHRRDGATESAPTHPLRDIEVSQSNAENQEVPAPRAPHLSP